MAEDIKQENYGPAFTQVGDHNQQHVHIERAFLQAAPLEYEDARKLIRQSIQTFLSHLSGLKEARHSTRENAAEEYVQQAERVTRPLVEALAQGVLRMPGAVLDPEVERLFEAVLEFEGLTEFHGGNNALNASFYPLYLIALGLLGTAAVNGHVSGLRGLVAPTIRWGSETLPWLILLPLLNTLGRLLTDHPHAESAGITVVSDRASRKLFEPGGWLKDVLPAAGGRKYFVPTEALLGMLVFGAQQCRQSRAGDVRLNLLMGRYLFAPDEAIPLLGRWAQELERAQFTLDWFPDGVQALHAWYVSDLGRRSGW